MFIKASLKNSMLFIALAIIAAVGIIIAAGYHPAAAKNGQPKPSNASIGAVPECVNGTWVNHASVISNNSFLSQVDIYETLNSTQVIKIQDQLSLSTTVPYTFDTTPAAGVTEDVLYVLVHNSVPLGDIEPTPQNDGGIAHSAPIFNPCH